MFGVLISIGVLMWLSQIQDPGGFGRDYAVLPKVAPHKQCVTDDGNNMSHPGGNEGDTGQSRWYYDVEWWPYAISYYM